jgi:uncharacterized protein YndB with AHSA1/START domain
LRGDISGLTRITCSTFRAAWWMLPATAMRAHPGEGMKQFVAAMLLCVSIPVCASERAITESVVVKAPIEKVWAAWTTSAGIRTFFAPDANVEARVGGPFAIYINPLAAPGMTGADDMVFLALQSPTMLSFTWNAPPHLPEVRKQRTYVTIRLAPQGDGETLVTLYHGGWGTGGEWDQAYAYFGKAWPNVLKNLQKSFVDGPYDWTAWMEQLKKMMEKK